MKPNLTSNIFLTNILKKNTNVSNQKKIILNTFFFNFVYFTLLLLILLFLLYLYIDKKRKTNNKNNKNNKNK